MSRALDARQHLRSFSEPSLSGRKGFGGAFAPTECFSLSEHTVFIQSVLDCVERHLKASASSEERCLVLLDLTYEVMGPVPLHKDLTLPRGNAMLRAAFRSLHKHRLLSALRCRMNKPEPSPFTPGKRWVSGRLNHAHRQKRTDEKGERRTDHAFRSSVAQQEVEDAAAAAGGASVRTSFSFAS